MKKLIALGFAACAVATAGPVLAQAPASPTEGHKVLLLDEGTWHVDGKMWMPGTEEPIPFEGKETNRMLGELHSISDFEGNFGGMEFRGHGTLSYDPESNSYSGTWIDVMESQLTLMKGTWNAETRTMTTQSSKKGPDGSPMKGKSELVYKGEDSRILTMYSAPADSDEWHKDMEITYTRLKEPDTAK